MLKNLSVYSLVILISGSLTACSNNANPSQTKPVKKTVITKYKKSSVIIKKKPRVVVRPAVVYKKRKPTVHRKRVVRKRRSPVRRDNSFTNKLSNAALGRLRSRVRYDGSYHKLAYPWGDVPQNIGVCTDVVIRSYRRLGIDLQQQVHNDMSFAFSAYPNVQKWGLSKPDANIDHRRVYNLRAFFARRGAALPITRNPRDYRPGDLVTWMVGRDLPHIGVVVNRRSKADPSRYMIVHNIANGPEMEDVLFRFPITGHYRYTPTKMRNIPKPSYASSRGKSGVSSTPKRGMDYAQLVQAAKLLGTTNTGNRKASFIKIKTTKVKKARQITLANLTNAEMKLLYKK